MESFGSLVLRVYSITLDGNRSRSKVNRLHAFHGRRDECLIAYAKWRKYNIVLAGEVNACWEVREAIHPDDLPSVPDEVEGATAYR